MIQKGSVVIIYGKNILRHGNDNNRRNKVYNNNIILFVFFMCFNYFKR